jgi:hypothetical protein
VAVKPACRKLTSNIHSSDDLNRPEAKRFRVKLANLNIPKIYFVRIFLDLLEAENLKSKDLANEHPAFMPADVAAVVNSPEFKSLRMNMLDEIARKRGSRRTRSWELRNKAQRPDQHGRLSLKLYP